MHPPIAILAEDIDAVVTPEDVVTPDDAVTPEDAVAMRLRRAGLRPTRQRIALAGLLFGGPDRHVSAEMVCEEAVAARLAVSLATVYNTLNQFNEAGLLRELPVAGAKSFFDTRTDPHHHFHDPRAGRMIDVPAEAVCVSRLPPPPPGMEIAGVEVMIRLKPITAGASEAAVADAPPARVTA